MPSKKKSSSSIQTKSASSSSLSVGAPTNFQHRVNVDSNFQWKTKDPLELFELQAKLGEGSFGYVFKALHKDTGKYMAVKSIVCWKRYIDSGST